MQRKLKEDLIAANGQILNHSQKIEALKENYSNEIIELKKKIAEFEKNEVHRYTTVPQLIITNIKDILAQVMHIQELRKTQEKLHQMQSEIESLQSRLDKSNQELQLSKHAAPQQIANLDVAQTGKENERKERRANPFTVDSGEALNGKSETHHIQEIERQSSIITDLQQQLDFYRHHSSSPSPQDLENLRNELEASQKHVQRLEEERQLSKSAIEEARKVLIECGHLRAELKEKDDVLKEAQSLVLDQETTISLLQSSMQEAEARSEAKLRELQDQISLLKVVIEDLKAQHSPSHFPQV